MTNYNELPLRPCVGIMLLNKANKIWIGRRISKPHDNPGSFIWQMPQGGIDKGEKPDAAALRELQEETGIINASIIKQSQQWYNYELPEELRGKALKGKYRGQTQKWFAMRFEGKDNEVDISEKAAQKAEFDQWRWSDAAPLPDLIVPFKRTVYQNVIAEFSDLF